MKISKLTIDRENKTVSFVREEKSYTTNFKDAGKNGFKIDDETTQFRLKRTWACRLGGADYGALVRGIQEGIKILHNGSPDASPPFDTFYESVMPMRGGETWDICFKIETSAFYNSLEFYILKGGV